MLSLKQCIESGVQKNSTLLAAKELVKERQFEKNALLARLIPSIAINGRFDQRIEFGSNTTGQSTNFYLSLGWTQPLLDYVDLYHQISRSEYQRQIALQNYLGSSRGLELKIKVAYFETLLNQTKIKILSNQVARKEESVSKNLKSGIYDLEMSAIKNIIQMDIQSLRYSIALKQAALSNNMNTLFDLAGLEKNRFSLVENIEAPLSEYDLAKATSNILVNSWEIRVSKLEQFVSKEALKSQIIDFWPSPTLYSSISQYVNSYPGVTSERISDFRIGVGITYPLFSWIETSQKAQTIKSHITGLAASERDLYKRIERDALNTLNQFTNLKKEREILLAKRESLMLYYQILKQKFQFGKIDYPLLQFQEDKLAEIEISIEDNIFNLRSLDALIFSYSPNTITDPNQ